MKYLFLLLMTIMLVPACAAQERAGIDRLAPPAPVDCERNHLTSYQGRLLALSVLSNSTAITLLTDWNSEERFTVPADSIHLLNGSPLEEKEQATWLESLETPFTGIGVIAWVCLQPEATTLDWRPGPIEEDGQQSQRR